MYLSQPLRAFDALLRVKVAFCDIIGAWAFNPLQEPDQMEVEQLNSKKKFILVVAVVLVVALALGTVSLLISEEEEKAEPVEEIEALEEEKEEKEDEEKDKESADKEKQPGNSEATFEHEVEMDINGDVKYDQGEEWWKSD